MTDSLNPFRSRLVKITEPGWTNYTGVFGNIEFANGISTLPVAWLEQQRLGAIVRMESCEEGEGSVQLGPSAEILRTRAMNSDHDRVKGVDKVVVINGEAKLTAANFSREELEEIADKEGLAGLRKIGTPLGAKGRSINELIAEILERQGNSAPGGDDGK